MQDSFPELTNADILSIKFFKVLQQRVVLQKATFDAAIDGESPEISDIIKELKHIQIETIIGGIPLWQLLVSTFLDFVADNNRSLLKAVADLVSDNSHS
jgi:hypothetical protein